METPGDKRNLPDRPKIKMGRHKFVMRPLVREMLFAAGWGDWMIVDSPSAGGAGPGRGKTLKRKASS